jgi:hypothetical protein
VGELLVAIGQAWPRLLLYPGGLSVFVLALLIGGKSARRLPELDELLLALGPLLLISLLPLPPASPFPFSIDVITALALLELPRWAAEARLIAQSPGHFLRPYLPLLLGSALLYQAQGSFSLTATGLALDAVPFYVAGALLWSLALPSIWREHANLAMALRTAGHLLVIVVIWSRIWP